MTTTPQPPVPADDPYQRPAFTAATPPNPKPWPKRERVSAADMAAAVANMSPEVLAALQAKQAAELAARKLALGY